MANVHEPGAASAGSPVAVQPAPLSVATDSGVTLLARPATEVDDAALRALFRSVTMEADLALQVRRDPNFFALYRMQDAEWEAWVVEQDGIIVALGTLMARDGYLAGKPTRVGYLGDLRLDPSVRGGDVIRALYGPVLDDFATRHSVNVFFTVVIASNARAVKALTGPRAAAMGIPTYHLLQKFAIRAVQTVAARRPTRHARRTWRVRTAAQGDLPAIAELLDRDARTRAFGMPMDTERLRAGIARWPGLELNQFHLLEHRDSGELVGCIAPWDATPVKQTYATAYRGSMRWVRRAHTVFATMVRAPRLPRPGGPLRYAYATHHALSEPDPEAAGLLLHAAWRSLRESSGDHVFLSCRAPVDDPLNASYGGFVTSDLPAHVYAVVPHGGPLPAALADVERVGFEMAFV